MTNSSDWDKVLPFVNMNLNVSFQSKQTGLPFKEWLLAASLILVTFMADGGV